MIKIYTIGFAQKSAEEFFEKLTTKNVKSLIDIRLNNSSQLAGFTNVKHLPYLLKLHSIAYVYMPEYAPTKELLEGYKSNKISWAEYEVEYRKILNGRKVLDKLDLSAFHNSVLLCSEPTAIQCHRRLLAEYIAMNNNVMVEHI